MPLADYYKENNKFLELVDQGKIVTADKALVLAGPPSYEQISINAGSTDGVISNSAAVDLYPLGEIQGLTISQAQNINALKGIGSPSLTWGAGAGRVSFSLGRAIFNKASLLRALYAYYPHEKLGESTALENNENYEVDDTNKPRIQDTPGYKNFYIDLQSDLFKKHFGLMVFLADQNFDPSDGTVDPSDSYFGAIYIENCIINAHNINLSAGDGMVGEGMTIIGSRARPVQITS